MFRKLILAALVQLSYSTAFSQSMDTVRLNLSQELKLTRIAKVHIRQDQNQLVQVVDKGIGSSVELHKKMAFSVLMVVRMLNCLLPCLHLSKPLSKVTERSSVIHLLGRSDEFQNRRQRKN